MLTSKKHQFHIVLPESMMEELKSLDLYKKTNNLSFVIVNILTILNPVLKVEHEWGYQRESKYLYVSEDSEEKRKHVAVYMQEKIYRQLKLMHQDLNFYSIAQLVRALCEFFLELVKEYGDGVYNYLKNEFKRWKEEKEKNKYRITTCDFLQQLCENLPNILTQKGFITIYNDCYVPIWIYQT